MKNKKRICSFFLFPFPKLSKSGLYKTSQEPWGLAKTIDSDCKFERQDKPRAEKGYNLGEHVRRGHLFPPRLLQFYLSSELK